MTKDEIGIAKLSNGRHVLVMADYYDHDEESLRGAEVFDIDESGLKSLFNQAGTKLGEGND